VKNSPYHPERQSRLLYRAALVVSLALGLLLTSCKPQTETLAVKSWKTWTLPPLGPTQPTPRSLTVGPNDQLAVLDTAGRILIYNANGELQRQWKMLDVKFGKPEGIVWLKDNRLIVCDTHYFRLTWFDLEGRLLKTVGKRGHGPGEFIFPVGICIDPDENLYVCEYGGHDRIQKFTREGELLAEFGSYGTEPGQFQRPSGLTWHNGQIYVVDAVNNRIHQFTDAGKFVRLFGKPQPPTLNLPYDITVAPDGFLYIVEYGAGRLSKFSTDGKLLGTFGKTGQGESEFATPWGLTVNSKMQIFIADTKNRRIVTLQL